MEGKLYITELSSNPNIKDKIQLAELMKKQVNCQSDLSSTDFGKTELYKILEMLNWNNKVVNFVVVKLLFHWYNNPDNLISNLKDFYLRQQIQNQVLF